jgi:hypothetical protein
VQLATAKQFGAASAERFNTGERCTTCISFTSRREESRQPYDYYKLPSTVPGDKAFRPLSARECPLVRAANKKAWRAQGFEEQTAPKSR